MQRENASARNIRSCEGSKWNFTDNLIHFLRPPQIKYYVNAYTLKYNLRSWANQVPQSGSRPASAVIARIIYMCLVSGIRAFQQEAKNGFFKNEYGTINTKCLLEDAEF